MIDQRFTVFIFLPLIFMPFPDWQQDQRSIGRKMSGRKMQEAEVYNGIDASKLMAMVRTQPDNVSMQTEQDQDLQISGMSGFYFSDFRDSAMRRRSGSISMTVTLTMSPTATTSDGSRTKRSASCEM